MNARRLWWIGLGLIQAASAQSPAAGPLVPGPFRVGFSIAAVGSSDRLQIATWYPAGRGGTPLTYGDYLDVAASERATPKREAAAKLEETRRRYADFMAGVGVDSVLVRRLRALPMLARRNAGAVATRRPLVVIVQGNGQPIADQAILAEHLASYGYVVATSPSVTRRRGPPASEDAVGAMAERQADDIARVVKRLRQRPDVDGRRIGLVGHSFGARGALLFQMRTGAAAALVSLDGGIGTITGLASMRAAPSFQVTRYPVPILHFFERLSAPMNPDWSLLRSLRGEVAVGRVLGMRHHHFTDLGGLVAALPDLAGPVQATPETAAAYRSVARATLAFLRRALDRSGNRSTPLPSDSLVRLLPLTEVERAGPAGGPS